MYMKKCTLSFREDAFASVSAYIILFTTCKKTLNFSKRQHKTKYSVSFLFVLFLICENYHFVIHLPGTIFSPKILTLSFPNQISGILKGGIRLSLAC